MRIYCFYLVAKHISNKKYPAVLKDMIVKVDENDCVLYAYTPDKENAKFFRKSRNMDLFFEKEIRMSREEYEVFADENVETCFEQHSLNTNKSINGKYHVESTVILCTMYEYITIAYYKSDYIRKYILDITPEDFIITCFNKKVMGSLCKLRYPDIMNAVLYPIDDTLDLNCDAFEIDEISLYARLFSNTFKVN